jgi:hypothetical protein
MAARFVAAVQLFFNPVSETTDVAGLGYDPLGNPAVDCSGTPEAWSRRLHASFEYLPLTRIYRTPLFVWCRLSNAHAAHRNPGSF